MDSTGLTGFASQFMWGMSNLTHFRIYTRFPGTHFRVCWDTVRSHCGSVWVWCPLGFDFAGLTWTLIENTHTSWYFGMQYLDVYAAPKKSLVFVVSLSSLSGTRRKNLPKIPQLFVHAPSRSNLVGTQRIVIEERCICLRKQLTRVGDVFFVYPRILVAAWMLADLEKNWKESTSNMTKYITPACVINHSNLLSYAILFNFSKLPLHLAKRQNWTPRLKFAFRISNFRK